MSHPSSLLLAPRQIHTTEAYVRNCAGGLFLSIIFLILFSATSNSSTFSTLALPCVIALSLSWWALEQLHIYKTMYTKLTKPEEADEGAVYKPSSSSSDQDGTMNNSPTSFAEWLVSSPYYDVRGKFDQSSSQS